MSTAAVVESLDDENFATNAPLLSVVIPCFNEEARILPVLDSFLKNLDRLALTTGWEIVVANDGSTDRTAEVIAELYRNESRIRCVTSTANRGKGWAVKMGLNAARAKVALVSDSDLSTDLSVLPAMLAQLREADLVVGTRFYKGAQFDPPRPLTRRFASRLFRVAVQQFGLAQVSDPQCGFKLLSVPAVLPLFNEMRIDRYAYEVELLFLANKAGLRILEMPILWTDQPGSHVHPFRDGVVMFRDLVRIRWSK